MALYHGRNMCQ